LSSLNLDETLMLASGAALYFQDAALYPIQD
jgi:hypothetical protein